MGTNLRMKDRPLDHGVLLRISRWWPTVVLAVLTLQCVLLLVLRVGTRYFTYHVVVNIIVGVLLILATGLAILNAVEGDESVRIFWSFLAVSLAIWTFYAWNWTYAVEILRKNQPVYLMVTGAFFLRTVFLIAAAAARPHLKLSQYKPYRTTLSFFLLLFSWAFAYAFVLLPISYGSGDDVLIMRVLVLLIGQNIFFLVLLGVLIAGTQSLWKSIYWHLLGASALSAVGTLISHLAVVHKEPFAVWPTLAYSAAACWFVWIVLRGRTLATELAQSTEDDTSHTHYASMLAMASVIAIPIIGVWELLRADEPQPARVVRLLIVLLAVLFLAIAASFTGYFTQRELSSDISVAHERLRMAMASGKSVGWEWNIATGKDRWFGDLQTMFGIPSDTFSGRTEDFYRYVHAGDQRRVSEAVTDARVNHKPYESEFRVVRQDGTVRWVAARGAFYYSKTGKPERMLGMAVDITERKRAEEALKTSEEKFSKAFRESPLALVLANTKDFRFLEVNETFEQITGWTRSEVIGCTSLETGLWVDQAQRQEFFKQLLATGAVRNWEVRFRRKDRTVGVALASTELIEIEGQTCSLSVIADITDRKQMEEATHESEERLQRAFQAGNMFAYEWDAATDMITRSPTCKQVLGNDQPTHISWREHLADIHPDDQLELTTLLDGLTPENNSTQVSYRVLRPDGSVIWLEQSAQAFFGNNGKLIRIVGIVANITDRKRGEQALVEGEERFRLVANTAPVLIWMTGPDKECTYVNRPWLEFTGRSLEAAHGDGWTESVHPDDLRECLNVFSKAVDRREPFRMQYRLRRHDGEYRWMLDTGLPRFNSDQSLAGYIGSCVDVTDHKQAEEALGSVGRRLIEAHEEERAWIARELHDDVNQRLALLAIELQRTKDSIPEAEIMVRERIDQTRNRLMEISKDVQELSHRLHSSKLEYLGIIAAINSFCKELTDRHKVTIDFNHSNIPQTLSKDVGLCLFRVVQEGLQNAVKHSSAREFKVELHSTNQEIHLTVSDAGVGFDWRDAVNSRGLGLISMRERLQLMKGRFSIESERGRGTTISAWVPLDTESYPTSMAG
jgi:PAS domain S-box-containing protein